MDEPSPRAMQLFEAVTRYRPRSREACPHCGWTLEKLRQTGLLGCPLCYEVFRRALEAGETSS